jgi:periplasmic divalent cation tolerance protein
MSKAVVILCTTASKEKGKTLARLLVEEKLAACVNLQPITSIYSWQGKMTEDEETLLQIKSTEERLQDITSFILKNHDYGTPEVIALPVIGGSEKYLDWIDKSVEKSTSNSSQPMLGPT